MSKVFESILVGQCPEWRDTEEHEKLNEQLTKELKSLNAYTNEVESIISCYGAQCIDDGITIGFITAMQLFRELSEFTSKYRREDYGEADLQA